MSLIIHTNNHKRDVIYGFELSPKERKEFDYYNEEELMNAQFFRYKDNVYDLGEFFRVIPQGSKRCHPTECDRPDFAGWHGYQSDTFFSGLLIKWPVEEWGEHDFGHVIVGWYCI